MSSTADLHIPSIDGLRAFEAAARLGGFERAAGELHITASAVGKRVAAVEATLGQPLFTRQGSQLMLTPGGREYLDQVHSALGLLAAMPQHRREHQRVQRVRLSAPPTFARQILVPELASFTQAHPEVELEVVLSIPFLDVSPGVSDVEVRTSDGRTPGQLLLMDDVVLPMAAPALLDRLPNLRDPSDLDTAPLVRTPIEPWTPWWRAAGLHRGEPTQGPRLVDLGLALEAALSGHGVALVRPSLARREIERGALVPLFGPCVRPPQRYAIVAHTADAAALGFARWLHERCETLAEQALASTQGLLRRRGAAVHGPL
jgi:LysR family transcriptional regulator, glycine cleavage system transcriptional activator